MSKKRITLSIDEKVLRAVKARAGRIGKGQSEVVEEAVRKDLGLDLIERLWARNKLTEDEAMRVAIEGKVAARRETSLDQPAPSPPRQPDLVLITDMERAREQRAGDVDAEPQEQQ